MKDTQIKIIFYFRMFTVYILFSYTCVLFLSSSFLILGTRIIISKQIAAI